MKPNIVIFISHDTGRFLSPYQFNTVNTPSFEHLGKESCIFDNCFCTTPLCSPARSALLTGLYPHQNGMNGLPMEMTGDFDLIRKDRHIANLLKKENYHTVLCGLMHEAKNLFEVGFEEGIHGSGLDANFGNTSLLGSGSDIKKWFGEHPDAGKSKNFYMQIGCHQTHLEWEKDSLNPYNEKGIRKFPYLLDSSEIDEQVGYLQGAVNSLDTGVGEILDAFEELELSDNTIFIFTTDHGIDLPCAKGTVFDTGTEVYLFMKYKNGKWNSNVHKKQLISHLDVYATLVDLLDLKVDGPVEGTSLLKTLTGENKKEVREEVFFEKTYHDNYDPIRAVRTNKYKFVKNMDAQTVYDVRMSTAERYHWMKKSFLKWNREEFYDLVNDPEENHDLINDENYIDLINEYRIKLAKWMKSTNDPLLDGPMTSCCPYHMKAIKEMNELGNL